MEVVADRKVVEEKSKLKIAEMPKRNQSWRSQEKRAEWEPKEKQTRGRGIRQIVGDSSSNSLRVIISPSDASASDISSF